MCCLTAPWSDLKQNFSCVICFWWFWGFRFWTGCWFLPLRLAPSLWRSEGAVFTEALYQKTTFKRKEETSGRASCNLQMPTSEPIMPHWPSCLLCSTHSYDYSSGVFTSCLNLLPNLKGGRFTNQQQQKMLRMTFDWKMSLISRTFTTSSLYRASPSTYNVCIKLNSSVDIFPIINKLFGLYASDMCQCQKMVKKWPKSKEDVLEE